MNMKTDLKGMCVRMLLCLGLLSPGAMQAHGGTKDALASVPADAIGCVVVPNLKAFDANYKQTIAALGMQAMVQPPTDSIVSMLKMNLPFGAAINENGPMAFVIMPATNPFELAMKIALVVSANEPKAMLEKMGATLGENGIYTVTIMGRPSYATIKGSQLIFAQMPDVAKAIAESKEGLNTKLAATETKMLDGLDIFLWIGADTLLPMIRPQVEGFMDMAAMAQGGTSPLAMKQAQMNKKQLGMLFEGLKTLGLGLDLDATGLDLRVAATTKPGTELHKNMKVRTTTEPLLRSLPGGDYMFAFGQTADSGQVEASVESLDDYVSMINEIEGIDKELVEKLKKKLEAWIPLNTGVRMSMKAVAPNENGVFQATLIMDTTDSKAWMDHANGSFDLVKTIFMEQKVADLGSEAMTIAKATSFTASAEKIGDADVAHLKIDLSQIENLDEDVIEDMSSVIGKDGPLLRVAAANGKTVVITFGGGSKHLENALTLAKSGDSPLDAHPGIQNTSMKMAKSRYMVGYMALDQFFAGLRHAMLAMDEDPLPIQFPKLNAPLGICGTGGEGWSQIDIYVPMPVVSAAKDAAMAFMGTQGAPPAAMPAPAETPEK